MTLSNYEYHTGSDAASIMDNLVNISDIKTSKSLQSIEKQDASCKNPTEIDPSFALKSLISSRLRWDILKCLETPMRLADLRREVGANAPNTSAKAKDLQKLGLVEKNDGDYSITRAGELIYVKLSYLMDTVNALYSNMGFWSKLLDDMPNEFLGIIHQFKEAKRLENDREDVHRVEKTLIGFIESANKNLFLLLPADYNKISEALRKIPKRVKTKIIEPDKTDIGFGLAISDKGIMIFTGMLDTALVVNSKF